MNSISSDSVISAYQYQLESSNENATMNTPVVSVDEVCIALDNQDLVSNLFDKKNVESLLAQKRLVLTQLVIYLFAYLFPFSLKASNLFESNFCIYSIKSGKCMLSAIFMLSYRNNLSKRWSTRRTRYTLTHLLTYSLTHSLILYIKRWA